LENPRNQDVDDAFGDVDDEKGIKMILKMMKWIKVLVYVIKS
jgi:hypothetical protein